jgi:hypothetical protein
VRHSVPWSFFWRQWTLVGEYAPVNSWLTTAQKVKKNRDDLLDLCESIVEIVHLLEAEVSAHGDVAGMRFMGLCEDFIA